MVATSVATTKNPDTAFIVMGEKEGNTTLTRHSPTNSGLVEVEINKRKRREDGRVTSTRKEDQSKEVDLGSMGVITRVSLPMI